MLLCCCGKFNIIYSSKLNTFFNIILISAKTYNIKYSNVHEQFILNVQCEV